MHFDSKLAIEAINECSSDLSLVGQPMFSALPVEVESKVGENEGDLSRIVISCELMDNSANATGLIKRPLFGFYNLVKAFAKEPHGAAVELLKAEVEKSSRDVDAKNNKGSTGLHACAYLKRWDLAQVLLDAGADPLCKNAAGHSFFLTAVRDPGSPWESLFIRHPELMDKHRKFLAKGAGRPREARAKSNGSDRNVERSKSRSTESSVIDGNERAVMVSEPRVESDPLLGAALLSKDWPALQARLCDSVPNLAHWLVSVVDQKDLAIKAPHDLLELMMSLSFVFCSEAAVLVARRSIEGGVGDATNRFWLSLGGTIGLIEQEELLNQALRGKRLDLISQMTKNRWRFGEDFIENCEEAGFLDLADDLIELKSLTPSLSDKAGLVGAGGPKHGAGQKRGPSNKSQKNSRSNGLGADKARGRLSGANKQGQKRGGGAAGAARRSAMIANFDSPIKEANEFEYKDKKPSTTSTIIIVKKARLIVRDEL